LFRRRKLNLKARRQTDPPASTQHEPAEEEQERPTREEEELEGWQGAECEELMDCWAVPSFIEQ
jgi:hypothetical protein